MRTPVPLPELPRWLAQRINRMALPVLGVVDNHYVSQEFIWEGVEVMDQDEVQAPADLEFRILDDWHYGPKLQWMPWAALLPKPRDMKVQTCGPDGDCKSWAPRFLTTFRIDRKRIHLTRRNQVSANAALAAKGLPDWDFVIRWRHMAAASFVQWWTDDSGGVL